MDSANWAHGEGLVITFLSLESFASRGIVIGIAFV